MRGQGHGPLNTLFPPICRIEIGQKWKLEKKLKNGNHQLCLRTKNCLRLCNRKKQTKRKIKQDHLLLFLSLLSAYTKMCSRLPFFAPFKIPLFLIFVFSSLKLSVIRLLFWSYHINISLVSLSVKKIILHVSAKYVFCLRHGKVNRVRLHTFSVSSVHAEKDSLPSLNITDIILLHHNFFY